MIISKSSRAGETEGSLVALRAARVALPPWSTEGPRVQRGYRLSRLAWLWRWPASACERVPVPLLLSVPPPASVLTSACQRADIADVLTSACQRADVADVLTWLACWRG